MDALDRARRLIDEAHAADPSRTPDGMPAELVYADRIEAWLLRVVPDPRPVLRLAARCQHLERWLVPRASFLQASRATWRGAARFNVKQSERARQVLLASGVCAADAGEAGHGISKTGLKTNEGKPGPGGCGRPRLSGDEIESFAAQHAGIPVRSLWISSGRRGER